MPDQTLLLKNADVLCTMSEPNEDENHVESEIKGGGLLHEMVSLRLLERVTLYPK